MPRRSNDKRAVLTKIRLCWHNARNHEGHVHALIYYRIDTLWKISSETCMDPKDSPHSTVPLKSNDKWAVFIKVRFCCCNTRNYESHDHATICYSIDSFWKISSETVLLSGTISSMVRWAWSHKILLSMAMLEFFMLKVVSRDGVSAMEFERMSAVQCEYNYWKLN